MDKEVSSEAFSWHNRRRIVFGTLYYCAAVLLYLVIFGEDTALNGQVAVALTGLAGATIGSYVFGAVWEDRSKINNGWPNSSPNFPRPRPVSVSVPVSVAVTESPETDCDQPPVVAHQGGGQ